MCLQDREEATLELSLFAEAFQEMLARGYGERILQALYTERCDAGWHLSCSLPTPTSRCRVAQEDDMCEALA